MALMPLRTPADYRQAVEQIRALQSLMGAMATQKGNVHPEVVALSQQLDEYIVSIQRYWRHRNREGSIV